VAGRTPSGAQSVGPSPFDCAVARAGLTKGCDTTASVAASHPLTATIQVADRPGAASASPERYLIMFTLSGRSAT